jgi:hypothetical protein
MTRSIPSLTLSLVPVLVLAPPDAGAAQAFADRSAELVWGNEVRDRAAGGAEGGAQEVTAPDSMGILEDFFRGSPAAPPASASPASKDTPSSRR